jgi:hypothetical protein
MMSDMVSLRSCQDWSLVRVGASIWTVFGSWMEVLEEISLPWRRRFTICAHLADVLPVTAASSSGVT